MAETNPKVLKAVAAAIKKDPEITNVDLFEQATKMDPEIGKLSRRQFNARYTLQVKRKLPGAGKKSRAARRRTAAASAPRRGLLKRAKAGPDRDAIRTALLAFASDLTAADERKDLVKVLANIDRYVDRIVKVSG